MKQQGLRRMQRRMGKGVLVDNQLLTILSDIDNRHMYKLCKRKLCTLENNWCEIIKKKKRIFGFTAFKRL